MKAPIYSINSFNNKLIYTKGTNLHHNGILYSAPFHIQGMRIFNDDIFIFGKNFLHHVKHEELFFNSWILDMYYKTNLYILTKSGEIYNHGKYLYNINISPTCGFFYEEGLLVGDIQGNIYKLTISLEKYELIKKGLIHDGIVFDIKWKNNKIITCSNDRSICIMDEDLNVLFKVYDNRERIYKCDIIECKENVLFYGITEDGAVYIYKNDKKFYQYNSKDGIVSSIFIKDYMIHIGFKCGVIMKKSIKTEIKTFEGQLIQSKGSMLYIFRNNKNTKEEQIERSVNLLDQPYILATDTIMRHSILNVTDFKGFSFRLKPSIIQEIHGILFCSVWNTIFILKNGVSNPIKTFKSNIIGFGPGFLALHDTVFITDDEFNICKTYKVKNITSHKEGIIGTRSGYICYEGNLYKVSEDAITDFIIEKEDLYFCSRDGFIYMIRNYRYVLSNEYSNRSSDQNFSNFKAKGFDRKIELLKRRFTYEKIEGFTFLNNEWWAYSFSNNQLNLTSFKAKSAHNLEWCPKNYQFINGQFCYFFKGKTLSYEINPDIVIHEDVFIDFILNNKTCNSNVIIDSFLVKNINRKIDLLEKGYMKRYSEYSSNRLINKNIQDFMVTDCYLVTESSILYIKNYEIYDKIYINEISCILEFNDLILVGTNAGDFFVLTIYDDRLWEVYNYKFINRIVSLTPCQYNTNLSVLVADGAGVVNGLEITNEGLNIKHSHKGKDIVMYGISNLNFVYLATSTGTVLKYDKNISPCCSKMIANGAIYKIIIIKDDLFLAISDDHYIYIFDESLNIIDSKNYHCGPIIDCIVMNNFIITLGKDKRVFICDSKNLSIKLSFSVKIYKPTKLIYYNGLYAMGQGMEKITHCF